MEHDNAKICVYFDGACPSCVKDRDNYLRLAGKAGQDVEWLDITHKDDELIALGINPNKAIKELHLSITSVLSWDLMDKDLQSLDLAHSTTENGKQASAVRLEKLLEQQKKYENEVRLYTANFCGDMITEYVSVHVATAVAVSFAGPTSI